MSFFKKLIGKEELTEEERLEKERIYDEKRKQRQEDYKISKEKSDKERIERQAEREEKKALKNAAIQEDLERFFGSNPGFDEKTNRTIYGVAIDRIRDKLLSPNETVIATVPAEYDMPGGKEVKGVLMATNQKLIFSSNTVLKEFTEIMDYKSMTSISLTRDGFLKKELHVISGREKRVFDDVKDNRHLTSLLDGVRQQISLVHSGVSQTAVPLMAAKNSKAQQLKEFAELRDSGILSEEEFQIEKAKILNN